MNISLLDVVEQLNDVPNADFQEIVRPFVDKFSSASRQPRAASKRAVVTAQEIASAFNEGSPSSVSSILWMFMSS